MSSHIAVFDIGKTNKKLLIYDENLKLIDTAREQFPEYTEGNVNFEPVREMTEWYLDRLSDFSGSYNIKGITVATQGATAVCVKEDASPAVPPIAYTTEPGEAFHEEFRKRFGGTEKIQRTTATALMSVLLNLAQLIVYLQKQYPKEFEETYKILGFPQYFGYVLTGKAGAEPTYMGCHTMLWEHRNKRWSYIAEELGIIDKLPKGLSRTWDLLGTVTPEITDRTGLAADTLVTMGVHDSNASLLPYLIQAKEEFILNSTGTWCAVMHPARELTFADDEIGKLVYYNLDVHSRPVKTSILLGGLEFETWSDCIRKINNAEDFPPFNPEVYKTIIAEQKYFIFPGIVKGTGQFPESEPRVYAEGKEYSFADIENGNVPELFRNYTAAMAVLNISIAIQTKVAMERVGIRDGMPIFIEGGFHKNPDYSALLTGIYKKSKIYLSNLEEATAFGAALLGKAALEGKDPLELSAYCAIEKREVEKVHFPGFPAYIRAFMDLL